MPRIAPPPFAVPRHAHHLLYALIRPWTRWGAKLWHRIDGEVPGAHYLSRPRTNARAKLLIAGHQNGLADPILACVMLNPQLHFFTRADVFRRRAARWVLLRFNMMPVFRAIDRAPNMAERNKATFEAAHARLAQGAVCGIFPEAGHLDERRIRRLRHGTARLVAGALKEPDVQMRGLDILPLRLDFERYEAYRSAARVQIGAPIPYLDIPDLTEDTGASRRALSDRMHAALIQNAVHLLEPPLYDVHLATCRFLEGFNGKAAEASLLRSMAELLQANPDDALNDFHDALKVGLRHPKTADDFAAAGRLMAGKPTRLTPHLWRYPAWFVFTLTTGWWPRFAQGLAARRLKDVAFRTTLSVPLTMVGVTVTWICLALFVGILNGQPLAVPAVMVALRVAQTLALPLEDALMDFRAERRIARCVSHRFFERWCSEPRDLHNGHPSPP